MLTLWFGLLAAQDARAPEEIRRAGQSVVALRFAGGHGSGFVIDAQGWIVTNAHVACSPLPYEVEARIEKDGQLRTVRFKKALLSGVHPTRDLALVKIDPAEHDGKLQAVNLAKNPGAVEQRIFAIGYPSSVRGGTAKVYSEGRIVSTDRQLWRRPYLGFDAPIAPGNSGGPLCAENGDVVGVVTLHDPISKTGYAVSAGEIRLPAFVPLRQRAPDPSASVECINIADRCVRLFREEGLASYLEYAFQYYETASFWDPGNDELQVKVGAFYALGGDFRSAAAHLTRSLTLNPWPEKGSMIYHALAASLLQGGRRDEAAVVSAEGLAKFPDRSGEILQALALEHHAARRWVEAAGASRRALRQNCPAPEEMNRVHQEARERMSLQESGAFLDQERTADADEAKRVETARDARRGGRAAITPDFQRFLDGTANHQREGGGAPAAAPGGSLVADVDRLSDDEVTRLFRQAQLKTAREHVRAGAYAQALEALNDILKEHPKSAEAVEAANLLEVIRARRKP